MLVFVIMAMRMSLTMCMRVTIVESYFAWKRIALVDFSLPERDLHTKLVGERGELRRRKIELLTRLEVFECDLGSVAAPRDLDVITRMRLPFFFCLEHHLVTRLRDRVGVA